MRVLITGATGFVGSTLLPKLLRENYIRTITVFILPGEDLPETIINDRISVLHGDITDVDAVDNAVKGQDIVVHLAGFISYWKKDLKKLVAINVHGVKNIVNACLKHKIKRLIHISSVGAIGYNKDGRLSNETTPYNWSEKFPYMSTKKHGEDFVLKAVRDHGLNAVVLNPASIMGPGDNNIYTPHNKLYTNIFLKPFFLGSFAGGLAIVDVRDLCNAIIKSINFGISGERYLIVGANIPYSKVLKYIGECARKPVYPFPVIPLIFTIAGAVSEALSNITKKRPLLTAAYGRLSGWFAYYSNEKSINDLNMEYRNIKETIFEGCQYFKENLLLN